MQHQSQWDVANGPGQWGASRAEILRAQVCSNRDPSFLMAAQNGLTGAIGERACQTALGIHLVNCALSLLSRCVDVLDPMEDSNELPARSPWELR